MVDLGSKFCSSSIIESFIVLTLLHSSSISGYTNNVVVASSIKIWTQFRGHFGLQTLSIGAPLAANPVFPPSLLDTPSLYGLGWAEKTLETCMLILLFHLFNN